MTNDGVVLDYKNNVLFATKNSNIDRSDSLPENYQSALCASFVMNFGRNGFPEAARGVCSNL